MRVGQVWLRLFLGFLVCALGFSGTARAVAPVGPAIKVDVDPGAGTPWYGFFGYTVVATQTGGFAAAWEEDTKQDQPTFPVVEGLKYRVFLPTLAPVAASSAIALAGRTVPGLTNLARLGTTKLYLTYGLTRRIDATHMERESYGQAITNATGVSAARIRLNSTTNSGQIGSRAGGLSDGRAIFAWFDGSTTEATPSVIHGRFINATGTPLAATLILGGGIGFAIQGIFPLDQGLFLASYTRSTTAGGQYRAHVFRADGGPFNAIHTLTGGLTAPLLATFSDGRILVATWVAAGSTDNLVAQIYDKNWTKIGVAHTLVTGGSTTNPIEFAATPDGGIIMGRTYNVTTNYFHQVKRFNSALTLVVPAYTFSSLGYDRFKIAVLSANRAVLVFKQNIGGRSRLTAQRVSY